MTASMLCSLSVLFLKKFRKIVSEKLHPCPNVLEHPCDYCRFSNILPKFYPGWIEFYEDEI